MNTFRKFLVAAVLTGAAATEAQAQIYVSGTVTGCFGALCAPSNFSATTGEYLRFRGSTFEALVTGSQTFGGNPAPPGFNVGNFGSFELSDVAHEYSGTPFLLRITFDNPAFGSVDFASTLSGGITAGPGGIATGSVLVDFTPTGSVVVPGGEAFALAVDVDDLEIAAHQTLAVGGTVYAASAVPEPGSIALVASGLLGLVGFARRRRSA